jgi:hypothetical protein
MLNSFLLLQKRCGQPRFLVVRMQSEYPTELLWNLMLA